MSLTLGSHILNLTFVGPASNSLSITAFAVPAVSPSALAARPSTAAAQPSTGASRHNISNVSSSSPAAPPELSASSSAQLSLLAALAAAP
ncbi:hypothetical protein B0H13DRAFT_2367207 [Mycena leptocephala]|nr:hypothetical protein B0H13DRAFT_2367207 [Mycena leptocephala]